MRCGFTLLWICAGVVRSLRVPRSLYLPAERAESRARLRWVFCCGTQESCVRGRRWLVV